jgi:sigma-B regulation protein RsbU (phosphoserine phosphatase)
MGLLNGNFLTAFYGYYREEDKTFHYARAGHNYPYLVRNGEIIPLTGKGKVLGVFEDEEFEEHTILLHRGDKILFYTDGLMEAANEKEVEFETVLPELLKKHISLPVENLVSEIYKEVVAFQGSEKFEDDVCLIGMEVE